MEKDKTTDGALIVAARLTPTSISAVPRLQSRDKSIHDYTDDFLRLSEQTNLRKTSGLVIPK